MSAGDRGGPASTAVPRPDAGHGPGLATFRRMWEFYLAYCEAGVRTGYLDVHQFGLSRAQ